MYITAGHVTSDHSRTLLGFLEGSKELKVQPFTLRATFNGNLGQNTFSCCKLFKRAGSWWAAYFQFFRYLSSIPPASTFPAWNHYRGKLGGKRKKEKIKAFLTVHTWPRRCAVAMGVFSGQYESVAPHRDRLILKCKLVLLGHIVNTLLS